MPNTKISKERLRTHLQYGKWVYLVILALGLFSTDLVYTMTEYRPPKERKVEFQLVGGYTNTEPLEADLNRALESAQAADATLEEVSAYGITYSGDAEADVYGAQKFMVMVAAQEGDIYFLNEALFDQLQPGGAFAPLDEYLESGLLSAAAEDRVTRTEPVEEGAPASEIYHVYGVRLSALSRLGDGEIGYDYEDKIAVLMYYSANPETSVRVLEELKEIWSVKKNDTAAG